MPTDQSQFADDTIKSASVKDTEKDATDCQLPHWLAGKQERECIRYIITDKAHRSRVMRSVCALFPDVRKYYALLQALKLDLIPLKTT